MKTVLTSVFVSAVLASAASALTIGGFDGTRTLNTLYSIDGANAARAELEDTANAPLYGDTISLVGGTNTVDSTYLSTLDVFVTGLLFDASPLGSGEVSALSSFIDAGGVVIAYGDNLSFDTVFEPVLNPLGLDVNNVAHNNTAFADPPVPLTTVATGNPLVDGPFGTVSSIGIRDSAFLLPASGDAVNVMTYAGGEGGVGFVGPNGARQGALIFLPDSETFGLGSNTSLTANFFGQPGAETVFNNAIAYAVSLNAAPVPLPAGLPMLLVGLGAFAVMRRRAQA